MARVTGIGGVFFKSKGDHAALAAWYQEHLGLRLEPWGGAILRWTEDRAENGGITVWHVAERDTDWFAPSDAPFMINYRVDDVDGLLANLRAAGVEILKGPGIARERQVRMDRRPGGQQGGAVGAEALGREEQAELSSEPSTRLTPAPRPAASSP